ncbi:transcriptional regulator GlxA family with amidase domain [Salibacterium salarium]|uniref:DJ-1/PfpI family protein n=1 Tax=Salibacterium salarium TaxID=284579 RepID=UPI002788C442|nr:DJ-1/PfpI family protein [Salibacterium salarium]MDQ0300265.1 transcriptional regulator GlxA family with amidase domain [Salibacterium salarium]
MKKIGIYIFDDVEVLDFAGPYEVFSVAFAQPDRQEEKLFDVTTISESGEMVSASNGLQVMPDTSLEDAPECDVIIIPGGKGARANEAYNEKLLAWIRARQVSTKIIASVCTGALVLANAGLLDGKKATTHWGSYERLAAFSSVEVQRDVKFVDEGSVITSGGISAGINMSFHLIEKLEGTIAVSETAKWMEYDL